MVAKCVRADVAKGKSMWGKKEKKGSDNGLYLKFEQGNA